MATVSQQAIETLKREMDSHKRDLVKHQGRLKEAERELERARGVVSKLEKEKADVEGDIQTVYDQQTQNESELSQMQEDLEKFLEEQKNKKQ